MWGKMLGVMGLSNLAQDGNSYSGFFQPKKLNINGEYSGWIDKYKFLVVKNSSGYNFYKIEDHYSYLDVLESLNNPVYFTGNGYSNIYYLDNDTLYLKKTFGYRRGSGHFLKLPNFNKFIPPTDKISDSFFPNNSYSDVGWDYKRNRYIKYKKVRIDGYKDELDITYCLSDSNGNFAIKKQRHIDNYSYSNDAPRVGLKYAPEGLGIVSWYHENQSHVNMCIEVNMDSGALYEWGNFHKVRRNLLNKNDNRIGYFVPLIDKYGHGFYFKGMSGCPYVSGYEGIDVFHGDCMKLLKWFLGDDNRFKVNGEDIYSGGKNKTKVTVTTPLGTLYTSIIYPKLNFWDSTKDYWRDRDFIPYTIGPKIMVFRREIYWFGYSSI